MRFQSLTREQHPNGRFNLELYFVEDYKLLLKKILESRSSIKSVAVRLSNIFPN